MTTTDDDETAPPRDSRGGVLADHLAACSAWAGLRRLAAGEPPADRRRQARGLFMAATPDWERN